jgi:putative addiction module component (TIGR02574 family)
MSTSALRGLLHAAIVFCAQREHVRHPTGSTSRTLSDPLERPKLPSMSSDEILPAALALPANERAKLAREILQSLQNSDPSTEAAWIDEIERRADQVENGTAQLVDWDVAREQIAQRLKARR